jgi:hypothetical protein
VSSMFRIDSNQIHPRSRVICTAPCVQDPYVILLLHLSPKDLSNGCDHGLGLFKVDVVTAVLGDLDT